jgi:hypothetical protein
LHQLIGDSGRSRMRDLNKNVFVGVANDHVYAGQVFRFSFSTLAMKEFYFVSNN